MNGPSKKEVVYTMYQNGIEVGSVQFLKSKWSKGWEGRAEDDDNDNDEDFYPIEVGIEKPSKKWAQKIWDDYRKRQKENSNG